MSAMPAGARHTMTTSNWGIVAFLQKLSRTHARAIPGIDQDGRLHLITTKTSSTATSTVAKASSPDEGCGLGSHLLAA
jgi:hypothetical protein